MHALLELLPLMGLVGGWFVGKSINPAEAMYYLSYGAIIGTLVQFGVYKLRNQRMQKTTLITGLTLIGFATITIIFKNDLFIKLKPTVLSWAFAAFFWGYAFLKKHSVLAVIMGEQFSLPASKWLTLNWAWVIFNVLVGFANLFVVWKISQGDWSNGAWLAFKGALLPISLLFIAGQTVYLFKHGHTKDIEHNDQQKM